MYVYFLIPHVIHATLKWNFESNCWSELLWIDLLFTILVGGGRGFNSSRAQSAILLNTLIKWYEVNFLFSQQFIFIWTAYNKIQPQHYNIFYITIFSTISNWNVIKKSKTLSVFSCLRSYFFVWIWYMILKSKSLKDTFVNYS